MSATITATLGGHSSTVTCAVAPDESNIIKMLRVILQPTQDLEDVLTALWSGFWVDYAVGAQLDLVGKKVGQPRLGLEDPDYRRYIRARIATNRSGGSVEDLITVAKLVINDVGAQILAASERNATAVIRIANITMTAALAQILISFLSAAALAGVRVILETSPELPARTFHTALAAIAPGALTSGATSVAVDSTVGFPLSGSLDLDLATAVAETVTYTLTDASHFAVSALAHNHTAGAAVQLHRTGRGCGCGTGVSAITAGDASIEADNTAGFPTSGTLNLAGTLYAYTDVPDTSHFTLTTAAPADQDAGVAYLNDIGGYLSSAIDH